MCLISMSIISFINSNTEADAGTLFKIRIANADVIITAQPQTLASLATIGAASDINYKNHIQCMFCYLTGVR